MRQGNIQRDNALSTLIHYFKTAWEAAGLTWTCDNQREIEGLVDDLHEATLDDINTAIAQVEGEKRRNKQGGIYDNEAERKAAGLAGPPISG